MMCIQTPGSLVWAASLAARLGTEGWSTWGVYVVTALLQGTLLIMGIYFEYINPSKAETNVSPADTSGTDDGTNGVEAHRGNEENHHSEETPLLQSTG